MALPKLLYLHVLLQVSLVLASSQCKSPMKGNVLLQMGILAHPPTFFLPACQSVVALPTQAYMSPIPLLWHWIMDFYGFLWISSLLSCIRHVFLPTVLSMNRTVSVLKTKKPKKADRYQHTVPEKVPGEHINQEVFTIVYIYMYRYIYLFLFFANLDIFGRAASLKKRFAYKAKWRGQPWRLRRYMTIGLLTEARFFWSFLTWNQGL